jgi:hypothetical protein
LQSDFGRARRAQGACSKNRRNRRGIDHGGRPENRWPKKRQPEQGKTGHQSSASSRGSTHEDQFEIQADRIKTPGGGLIIFNGMQDHTAESIKSLEGFDIAWVDEAQAKPEDLASA